MAEPIYTEEQYQDRLKIARDLARAMAWRDIFEVFSDHHRRHFANLMAHGYKVVGIELQHPDGRRNSTALEPADAWLAKTADGVKTPDGEQHG
jgi:hypothetical protein